MSSGIDHSQGHTADWVRLLEATGDYKVLRRLPASDGFGLIHDEPVAMACFLDFETTGTEASDKPIEIGMVQIEYGRQTGRLGRIHDRYSGFEDPGFAIPDEIIKLTGITDAMVQGKAFSEERIKSIVESSSLVIAHNAAFDRGFAERRFAWMTESNWACSMSDVPWAEAGIGSSKLEFIAFRLGFFYEAHRAVVDCEVTAAVLDQSLPGERSAMSLLLENARKPLYRIWAVGARFETKDILKANRYRWKPRTDGSDKSCWVKETPDKDGELEWLSSQVMQDGGRVVVETIDAKSRFTDRYRCREVVNLSGIKATDRR